MRHRGTRFTSFNPPHNSKTTASPQSTDPIRLTSGTDAQGGLGDRPCQLPPEFLDRGLYFVLVPGQLPKSQDLHVGQRLIWDGRTEPEAG